MNNRKVHLAEMRAEEKLQELREGYSTLEDADDDFYHDPERDNYEEYLRNQGQANPSFDD